MVRALRQGLSLLFGIKCLDRQHPICLQDTDDPGRADAVNRHVKDSLDHWGSVFVQNPVVLVLRVRAVAVGRSAQLLLLVPLAFITECTFCNSLFLDFCILGGMPAVVRKYVERGTFEGSLDIQRQLIADYREDIRKYAEGLDQGRILNVFDQIPPQLAKDNKKFQISKVASGARFKDYRGCIEWLSDAGMVNICYCLNFPELPLKGNYEETKYKLYFADSGLLVAMLDEEAQEDLRTNRNLGVYKGALYENIVGEALVKSGCGLYYYKREDSTLEEDFFVRTASELIPVEVKATNGRAKSLRTLISSEKYSDISHGIKLTGGNIGYSDNIYTFPYFCAFLLKRYLKSGNGMTS